MKGKIIIGANLGDEGKGTVVANYTKHSEGTVLNVLTNGGSQRAHSILTEDGSFTFQHFGSGTYYGADNYFSKFFILNPMQFCKEYYELQERGVFNKGSKIYRHPDCLWSTPFDMMCNQIIEEKRGEQKHGSCGMGIWETVLRYKSTFCVSFDEFLSMDTLTQKCVLNSIKCYCKSRILKSSGSDTIPNEYKEIWDSEGIVDHFLTDCQTMKELTTIIEIPQNYDNVIFENGQGLLLNDTGENIAGTTPSKTNSTYGLILAKEMGISDITLHYVTRPYLTRHGRGLLEKETKRNHISSDIPEDRTNHFNVFQDHFRYAPLDLRELQKRISLDSKGNEFVLEVTHCDEMDRISEMKKLFNNINTFDSALIK